MSLRESVLKLIAFQKEMTGEPPSRIEMTKDNYTRLKEECIKNGYIYTCNPKESPNHFSGVEIIIKG